MTTAVAPFSELVKPSTPYAVPLSSFPRMVGAYAAPKERFCAPPLPVMHEWLGQVHGEGELGKAASVPVSLLAELYPDVREYAFFTLMRGTPAMAKFQKFIDAVCVASSEQDKSFMETLKEFEYWGNSHWRGSVELFWREGADPAAADLALEVKWAAEMCSPDDWWMLVDSAVIMMGLFFAAPYVGDAKIQEAFAGFNNTVEALLIDLDLIELLPVED